MKSMLMGATALLLLLSVPAQAADTVTAADAVKVISQIKGDKEKVKLYCEAQDLYNQAADAAEKKDEKKAEELGTKADELVGKLGGDYQKLDEAMGKVDPNSDEVKKIAAEFAKLDESCKK